MTAQSVEDLFAQLFVIGLATIYGMGAAYVFGWVLSGAWLRPAPVCVCRR